MKMMLAILLAAAALPAAADQHVNGYMRNDGTYVQPYVRSTPNGTKMDNFSTRGNVNPYTGEKGSNNDLSPNLGRENSQGWDAGTRRRY